MSARLRFGLLLGLIFASVPLAWWLFLREPPPAPLAPPVALPVTVDAGPRRVEVKLGEVTGTVEIRHGADAGWELAREGDVLSPSDGVRTGDGSYAVLVGDEYWDVKMEPGTEVGIGELSESISKLLLQSGMARASVKGKGRHVFEVRATGSDAFASTDGGVFTMASNGRGTVAVGTESGEVLFSGNGRVVIVRSGQQSLVRPGEGPTAPAPVPASLLLKVALPGRQTVNKPTLVVRGTAEPGAMVEVQGRVVTVDEKGRFEAPVKLSEGKNTVQVRGRSVGGLEARSSNAVELDTTVKAPTIDRNLWE